MTIVVGFAIEYPFYKKFIDKYDNPDTQPIIKINTSTINNLSSKLKNTQIHTRCYSNLDNLLKVLQNSNITDITLEIVREGRCSIHFKINNFSFTIYIEPYEYIIYFGNISHIHLGLDEFEDFWKYLHTHGIKIVVYYNKNNNPIKVEFFDENSETFETIVYFTFSKPAFKKEFKIKI